MKKILIAGKDSYIGTSFEKWLIREPDKYKVDTIDMRNDSWKKKDFSGFDVIFYVAGIVHVKESKKNRTLFYKVNRDLVLETAQKAKKEGVKQFIFLSTMNVYGIEKGVIYNSTLTKPKNAYGKSKLEAEEAINKLRDDSFIVSILRPPMVYGKGCKGNYQRLVRLALTTPIFPKINNKRSMIYIDNLLEFIKVLIDSNRGGLFFPQNAEYVNTSEMVRLIAKAHGKCVIMTKLFNPIIKVLNLSTINKVFGDLVYDMSMSDYESNYRVCSFVESIKKTEMEY